MHSSDPEEFVGCLEEIASSRFLSPLLQEWREGETVIGRAIKLISEINIIRDEQIDSIIRDTEKRTRHPDDAMVKPISYFPLRCITCGHTYEYDLKNIYVGKEGNPVIGDIIQCKGCGSIETYEMTAHSQFGITAELLRVAALRKAQKEEDDRLDSPIKVYRRFDMTVLGREVKNMGEAYHLLNSKIEKRPQDADLQRRMGNLLKNGEKPDLAFPYYLEAIRLNQNDAESYYNIVDILIKQGKYTEAVPYLERFVPLCRESTMDERMRRDMFSALLDQTYIVQKETGHKVELFPLAKPEDIARTKESITPGVRSFEPADAEDFEWVYHMFRYGRVPKKQSKAEVTFEATHVGEKTLQHPVVKGKKVGRNDPCPCGSGKKYKMCCGR